MTTSKYNKSEIMREAWKIFRRESKFGWTFGKCLSVAWRNAKTRIQNEVVAAKNTENFKAYTATKVFNYSSGIHSYYTSGAYSGD